MTAQQISFYQNLSKSERASVSISSPVEHNEQTSNSDKKNSSFVREGYKRSMPHPTDNKHNSLHGDSALDHKLVARVQKGDNRAFDLLVVKYQGKVASIVSRYISDFHEISDVTQEAFIKAYRAIHKFRGDSAFYTWLYRIAINSAKNYLQAKGRRAPAVDIEVSDAEQVYGGRGLEDIASPEGQLNTLQLEQVVHEAIRCLPDDLRVAFSLREFEGLSYDEISEVMACPVGTVRSRIFRAREALDKAIASMDEK